MTAKKKTLLPKVTVPEVEAKAIKRDLSERFLTWEAAHGIFRLAVYLSASHYALFHLEWAFQAYAAARLADFTVIALAQVFVNRVKAKANFNKKVRAREAVNSVR